MEKEKNYVYIYNEQTITKIYIQKIYKYIYIVFHI